MPFRLLFASIAVLFLSQAAARSATAPAGFVSLSHPGPVPLQETRQREPGPADLKEAIEIALERYGGRAAGAETVEREGRRVHEIRVLLEDGGVRTVRIDPETGAIVPQQER
jgi:hypothetical protein